MVATRDEAVAPREQRALADALEATVFEAPVRHIGIVAGSHEHTPALLEAIASVSRQERSQAA